MIGCCLCAVWSHDECVGIKSADDSGGLWSRGECHATGARLKSLVETVTQLGTAVTDIGRQLTASEKARQDEREAVAAESASLHKENETLRFNVAAVNEKLTTLMWKTFRPPGQPGSLLIECHRPPLFPIFSRSHNVSESHSSTGVEVQRK